MKKVIIGLVVGLFIVAVCSSCGSSAPCPVYAENTTITVEAQS